MSYKSRFRCFNVGILFLIFSRVFEETLVHPYKSMAFNPFMFSQTDFNPSSVMETHWPMFNSSKFAKFFDIFFNPSSLIEQVVIDKHFNMENPVDMCFKPMFVTFAQNETSKVSKPLPFSFSDRNAIPMSLTLSHDRKFTDLKESSLERDFNPVSVMETQKLKFNDFKDFKP